MTTGSARENVTDILCIGAQKASTSWLHHVINAHQRTYAFPNSEPVTSTDKEAHFWDWNHHRGLDWYRNLMAVNGKAKVGQRAAQNVTTLGLG